MMAMSNVTSSSTGSDSLGGGVPSSPVTTRDPGVLRLQSINHLLEVVVVDHARTLGTRQLGVGDARHVLD